MKKTGHMYKIGKDNVGTQAILFIEKYQVKVGEKSMYLQAVFNIRLNKSDMQKFCLTAGEIIIYYHGNINTPTANITTLKFY